MDTALQPLAEFTYAARHAQVSPYALEQLKIRLLDTLGVAIAALDAPPILELRQQLPAATGGMASVIGGGDAAAKAAVRFNSALVRQLDFHDAYLTPAGTGHPSAGIPAVLAAAEIADAGGADLLTALAVLYATYTQLCDRSAAGVGAGLVGCSAAVAAAKAMGLDAAQTAAAVALASPAGTAASAEDPDAAPARAIRAVLQARQGTAAPGVTSPDVSVVDWTRADLEGVRRTQVRQYAADLHAQAPVDIAVSIAARPLFHPDAVRVVRVKTNQATFDRLGGGDGVDRYQVRTEAQARRSLPYAVAVALLDRALGPRQYAQECITRQDVQALLRKVSVVAHAPFTQRYPDEMRAQIEIERHDGIVNCTSTSAFRGSTLRPLVLIEAAEKFAQLAFAFTGEWLGQRIIRCVRDLEVHRTRDLTALLAQVSPTRW